MVNRLLSPLKNNSFFIFGARGVGKSTLLAENYKENSFLIDLLDDEQFDLYLSNPKRLDLLCEEKKCEWIIIDEIQRIPNLLNAVHRLIEKKKQKFILTGSSSRKLKRKGSNLLGGRAYVYSLYPFSYLELKEKFNLDFQLAWGSLPKHGAEIDLILSKGNRICAIEIKSSLMIDEQEVNKMRSLVEDMGPQCKSFYLSQDSQKFKIGKIHCLPWYEFLNNFETLV